VHFSEGACDSVRSSYTPPPQGHYDDLLKAVDLITVFVFVVSLLSLIVDDLSFLFVRQAPAALGRPRPSPLRFLRPRDWVSLGSDYPAVLSHSFLSIVAQG